MRCDVMLWDDVASRGRRILEAMVQAGKSVGVDCRVCKGKPSGAPWLMAYGLGHVGRRPMIDAHMKRGGQLIGWDLPYWHRGDRKDPDHPMRLTINADHPWKLICHEPSERWDSQWIDLRQEAKPEGPILLAGMGRQASALYPGWEERARAKIKKAFPKVPIAYRKKSRVGAPIADDLIGKRLVVVRHSNVAVDACIAGVPVICEDGAAYALYRDNQNPDREQRLAFLRSLAWWQWRPSEAVEAWKFIQAKLSN